MDADALKSATDQFNNARILVVGDLMLDHYIRGPVSRISPEAPVPVVEFASESFNLGGAGNAANSISVLGGEVAAVGVIGNDENGEKLSELLKEKGIDAEGLIIIPNRPTTTKIRVIAEQQQIVRIDKEVRDEIDDDYTEQILNFIKGKLENIDAILISDYDKGLITKHLLQGLIPLATKMNKPIIADSKFRHFSAYKGVTYITPNLKEASSLTGIRDTDETSIHTMGHRLLTQLECEAALITRGKDGMSLFNNNGDVTIAPSFAKEVYDVAGAGDTVASVFTLGLSTGLSAEDAALLGNIAAGIVIGKVGVATVTGDELTHQLEVLERNGMPEIRRFKANSK